MPKSTPEMFTVHAQDWHEFDPDYWNPMPERYTAYHLSLEGLRRYANILHDLNNQHDFITFEEASNPYVVEVKASCYQQLLKGQTVIIR